MTVVETDFEKPKAPLESNLDDDGNPIWIVHLTLDWNDLRALCGARMFGIKAQRGEPVCEKCKDEADRILGNWRILWDD